MDIIIKINTDNAAFSGDSGNETGRILKVLAENLENVTLLPGHFVRLRDMNGNLVGVFEVTETGA